MAVDGKLQMDHDALKAAAGDLISLGNSLTEVAGYAHALGVAREHFGGTEAADLAWQKFSAAGGRLATGVDGAAKYATGLGQRVTQSAAMTKETDVENAWMLGATGAQA